MNHVMHRWSGWKSRRSFVVAFSLPAALVLTVGLIQSSGFALRSWLADGSFHALYRDPVISSLAMRIQKDDATPRAAILDRPNAMLAAYGIQSPFGRRDWIAPRHARLLKAAGLAIEPPANQRSYADILTCLLYTSPSPRD